MEEQNESIYDPMNSDERIVVNLLCTEIRTLRTNAVLYYENIRLRDEKNERLLDAIDHWKTHAEDLNNSLTSAKEELAKKTKEVEDLKAELALLRYNKHKKGDK